MEWSVNTLPPSTNGRLTPIHHRPSRPRPHLTPLSSHLSSLTHFFTLTSTVFPFSSLSILSSSLWCPFSCLFSRLCLLLFSSHLFSLSSLSHLFFLPSTVFPLLLLFPTYLLFSIVVFCILVFYYSPVSSTHLLIHLIHIFLSSTLLFLLLFLSHLPVPAFSSYFSSHFSYPLYSYLYCFSCFFSNIQYLHSPLTSLLTLFPAFIPLLLTALSLISSLSCPLLSNFLCFYSSLSSLISVYLHSPLIFSFLLSSLLSFSATISY